MTPTPLASKTESVRAQLAVIVKAKVEGLDPFIGIGFLQELQAVLVSPAETPVPELSTSNLRSLRDRVAGLSLYNEGGTGSGGGVMMDAVLFRDAVLDLIDEALQVETSRDAQDAARYRFLRKGNDYSRVGPMAVLCEAQHIENDDRPFWSLADGALDQYIDEARSAEKTAGEPQCRG